MLLPQYLGLGHFRPHAICATQSHRENGPCVNRCCAVTSVAPEHWLRSFAAAALSLLLWFLCTLDKFEVSVFELLDPCGAAGLDHKELRFCPPSDPLLHLLGKRLSFVVGDRKLNSPFCCFISEIAETFLKRLPEATCLRRRTRMVAVGVRCRPGMDRLRLGEVSSAK